MRRREAAIVFSARSDCEKKQPSARIVALNSENKSPSNVCTTEIFTENRCGFAD